MPPLKFTPGLALSNQALWLEDLHFLKNQQIPIPKFAWNSVNNQAINLLEPEYCWANKRGIQFNNKKFGNFDQLVNEYKCKSEEDLNYKGCVQHKQIFEEMMESYIEAGIVKYATEEETKHVVLNPLNLLETREGKFSIVLHTLINSLYRKMDIQMMDVVHRGAILRDAKKLRSEDLVSCYKKVFICHQVKHCRGTTEKSRFFEQINKNYFREISNFYTIINTCLNHQYKLSENSIHLCGGRFKGKIIVFQTLFYGVSSAPGIVNGLNNLACTAESLRRKTYAEMFIDDLLTVFEEENYVKNHLAALGLQWKPTKSNQGEVIVFTGIEIDCKNKLMTVSEQTFEKMKKIVSESLMTSEDGSRWMHFNQFQILCGYLARLAKTCASGFVRAHSLLGRLGEAQENQYPMVQLTESDLTEIQFWTSKRHSMKMEGFKMTAGSITLKNSWIYRKNDGKSSEKRVKLSDTILNSSDSSLKHWGVKIIKNGKEKAICGSTPDHLKNESIAVMEANAAKNAIFEQEDKTEMALAVDSTVLAACFRNKRAKNKALNNILMEIFTEMARGQKLVSLYWIDTKTMAEQGADAISRQNYQEFAASFGLSEQGVDYVLQQYGRIKVDLYASVVDNPFKTLYCSTLENRNDRQNLRQNAAEFMLGNSLHGRMWCFPPDFLCGEALKLISSLKWKELQGKLQILLLVRSKQVAAVRFTLGKLAPLSWEIFYRRNAQNGKMKSKSQYSFVLFSIGEYRN